MVIGRSDGAGAKACAICRACIILAPDQLNTYDAACRRRGVQLRRECPYRGQHHDVRGGFTEMATLADPAAIILAPGDLGETLWLLTTT